MRNIQNRYEVCIYDKQRKEFCVCVSLLLRSVFSVKACTEIHKKKKKNEEIELEKKKTNNSNLTFEHAHCTRKHTFK